MSSGRRYALVLALAGLSVFLLSACGGGGEEGPSEVDFDDGTVAACLRDGGATFAASTDELGFFLKAEKEGELSGFGRVYDDEMAKLAVNVWSKKMPNGDPAEWTLWIAQPYLESRNVREIVTADPAGAYVAYVVRPDTAARRKLGSCVKF